MSIEVERALRDLAEAIRLDGGVLLEVTVDRRAWHRLATGMLDQPRRWPIGVEQPTAPEPDREGAMVATLHLTNGPVRFVGTRR